MTSQIFALNSTTVTQDHGQRAGESGPTYSHPVVVVHRARPWEAVEYLLRKDSAYLIFIAFCRRDC